jgi:hypothetical protein
VQVENVSGFISQSCTLPDGDISIHGDFSKRWNLSQFIQGVSKKSFTTLKAYKIYTEDIHNVLNCQNVAKHTEFYLG